jgi:hemerythrin superfamily protein
MDIVERILVDHRRIEELFKTFDAAVKADDESGQHRLALELTRELSVHAAAEEQVLYPALSRAGVVKERLDALEDHHAAKLLLSEIESMTPRQERFAAKVRVLGRNVARHLAEEETALLPVLRKRSNVEALRELGEDFEVRRRSAPTRPHPSAPDTPPANVIANAGASLVDRLRDVVQEGQVLLGAMALHLVRRVLRSGRDTAAQARRDGRALLARARARGSRAIDQARAVGLAVADEAIERGSSVADRIEHRIAPAARELMEASGRIGARAKRIRRSPRSARAAPGARDRRRGPS